mmetsp:Transcript_8439/g.12577  ORF Transcript_8439/g.12577 Transcript_8439/m.12577 type:complete len:185 (-) Transcript_8439:317-871(-)|eukprot:CAMPEP_0185030148 /NCGR_PEP_ID=MMETSP1103-20130426/16935_1 /TAXON_ID=36769 /ORGANISM="Paraphysomonas bandaiensis, Strain Caron Lab Isolate" /LENGTH=184 /DNA_ID=CAMNT_0027565149 /DNA_START=246 /DNA_END=800 /DNA_ORIENTATION=+
MNAIARKYGDRVAVLGFPCNQFGHQANEGSGEEFLNTLKYVRPGRGFVPRFHVFRKVHVNGAQAHPLFKFLRKAIPIPMDPTRISNSKGVEDTDVLVLPRDEFDQTSIALWSPVTRNDIAWNFEKFLVDGDGNVVRRYSRYYPTALIADDIDLLLRSQPQSTDKSYRAVTKEPVDSSYCARSGS